MIPNVLIPAFIAGMLSKTWQPVALAVVGLGLIWGCLIAVGVTNDVAAVLGAVLLAGANAIVGAAAGVLVRLTARGLQRLHPPA